MTRRCVDCDVPLVPKGHHVPDGHAVHAGHGQCNTCSRRRRRAAKRATIRLVGPCRECGRTMRAAGTAPLAGTVVERSKSVCCGCADRLDNGRTERPNDLPNAVARPPVIPDLGPMPELEGARCRLMASIDPDLSNLWHSDAEPDKRRAKAACQACPARIACLEYAMDNRERYGIWGGLDAGQREAAHRRARRAAS